MTWEFGGDESPGEPIVDRAKEAASRDRPGESGDAGVELDAGHATTAEAPAPVLPGANEWWFSVLGGFVGVRDLVRDVGEFDLGACVRGGLGGSDVDDVGNVCFGEGRALD